MLVSYADVTVEGELCERTRADEMYCRTPGLIISSRHMPSVEHPLEIQTFGFKMDGYNATNLGKKQGIDSLSIFPDPVVDLFPKSYKTHTKGSEYLTINGNYLNLAAREDDVRITIGDQPCNLTALATTILTC